MENILIIGSGVSGKAAAMLANALNFSYTIMDDAMFLEDDNINFNYNRVVVSPGVNPKKSKLYKFAQKQEVLMQSEMTFGAEFLKSKKYLAVTGTNGKTTTVELITHLLNSMNIKAMACGNIGYAVSELAAKQISNEISSDIVPIIEVSSFQLELSDNFSPFAAAILNVASDHLDRYDLSLEKYSSVKHKIFTNVNKENQVLGSDFDKNIVDKDIFWNNNRLCSLKETKLNAPHNIENLLVAIELVMKISPNSKENIDLLIEGIKSFFPGKHRIEKFATINDVDYYNDSKATNPAAVVAAFDALSKYEKIVVLLGGLDKGMDFSELQNLAPRIRTAILYGESRIKLAKVLENCIECIDCQNDFELAVKVAKEKAQKGDALILSPACASMDMFKNYQQRGEIFIKLAKN